MSQLDHPLDVAAIDQYINEIMTRIEAGDNATQLQTNVTNFDGSNANLAKRLRQAFKAVEQVRVISNGQVTFTMTAPGTGYSKGDVIPVTGDGVGASIIVTSVGGSGEILTFDTTSGEDYVATATVDTTGVGGADAAFTTAISNEKAVLDQVYASLDTLEVS